MGFQGVAVSSVERGAPFHRTAFRKGLPNDAQERCASRDVEKHGCFLVGAYGGGGLVGIGDRHFVMLVKDGLHRVVYVVFQQVRRVAAVVPAVVDSVGAVITQPQAA